MAEIALALFTAIGTVGSTAALTATEAAAAVGSVGASAASWAAGTTVATAGTGILGTVSELGSTALGVLQGVSTAASVASTLVGGVGSMLQGQQSAELAELQGNSEYLASEGRALQIRRDLIKKVGDARVAFAGSGLDISSAGAVESDLRNQAAFATEIEKTNAEEAKAMAAMRARQYRNNGSLDLVGASLKALGQAGGYGLDIAKRG